MGDITARDFDRKVHHEFYKTLRAVEPSGARGFHELFADFLLLSATAIHQGAHKMMTGELDAAAEAEYMRVVGKYDRERSKRFSEALGLLVIGLEEETHDFLGEVFGRAGISNKWAGQFFTPWPICQMMAKMTLGTRGPDPEHRMKVAEPAVGGGAMLLAIASELRAADWFPSRWWCDATDVDERCFHMAYLQLSLAGCPGVVRHGNTITMEQWKAWLTPLGAMFPLREKISGSSGIPPEIAEKSRTLPAGQLQLL